MTGSLCYKHGSGSLCYKHSGTSLIFKGVKPTRPGECTVQVNWRPPTWICQTYHVEHQNQFSCTGSFTAGSGNVSRTASGTSVVFILSNISGPATFTLSFSNVSNCVTTEDPGVTADFVAAQSGAAPRMKTNVHCPLSSMSQGHVAVSFDASGKLSGVQ